MSSKAAVRQGEYLAALPIRLTDPQGGVKQFQGQWEDEETGFYYNRYRYYDPKQGRYITQDPLGLAGGLNPYVYPLNPVGQSDPLGLIAMVAPLIPVGLKALGAAVVYVGTAALAAWAALTCSRSGRWSCTASCNVQIINPDLDGKVPRHVTGSANGKTEADACAEAKRVATQSAPRGSYARHCQCSCSKNQELL